MLYRICKLSI